MEKIYGGIGKTVVIIVTIVMWFLLTCGLYSLFIVDFGWGENLSGWISLIITTIFPILAKETLRITFE